MTNGNEPAFAQVGTDLFSKPFLFGGLTKRELFAAMAMQGFLADSDRGGSDPTIVRRSVSAADALIEALNKETK